MKVRIVRHLSPGDVKPGDLVETSKGLLVVDYLVLRGDQIEIAGRPPTRTEGRVVVATQPAGDPVDVVATDEVARKLLRDKTLQSDIHGHEVIDIDELTDVEDDAGWVSIVVTSTPMNGDGWVLEITA